ncbi:hypothetical protein ACKWTF_000792 [Chironomus riparius]
MAYQKLKERPTICDSKTRTICCPMKLARTTTTEKTTTTTEEPPSRISVKKCREYGKLIYEKQTLSNPVIGEPPIEKILSKCNHEVVKLIVGGTEASDREFPHMALIGFGEGKPEDYQCGGSLISEQWILSAAHCLNAAGSTANFAKLGYIIRNIETPNTYTYQISERISHPNYDSRFADDDIALFKLQQPAVLNSYVIPICLPDKELLTTKNAIATGYGKTGFVDDVSDVLMKVVIEYFNRDTCDSAFEGTGRFSNIQINWDKTVCAGSNNKSGDTCDGDSGGPLQIYNSDTYCMYTAVGITSFGYAYCGFPGVPAIYTKVYHYLDWIENIVWPNESV